jgi:hypothetical protein
MKPPFGLITLTRYTVTKKGTKHVKQRAMKESYFVLACQSDGSKRNPAVILKGTKCNSPRMTLYQQKAWMNSQLMVKWLSMNDFNGKHLVFQVGTRNGKITDNKLYSYKTFQQVPILDFKTLYWMSLAANTRKSRVLY